MSIDQLVMENYLDRMGSLEAENAVLGAILLDKNCYYTCADTLFQDIFSDLKNQYVFKAVKEIANESQNDIDIVTVTDKLRVKGQLQSIGGPAYISGLTNDVASSAHIQYHISILHTYWKIRQLQKLNVDINRKCSDKEDPDEIIAHINTEIVSINDNDTEEFDKEVTLKESLDSMQNTGEVNSVKTGIHKLDNFIYGFEYGDLICLAGAASMGKTAAALRLFLNWIYADLKPVFFSREMRASQLVNRLLSMESGVSLSKIRRKSLNTEDWNKMNVSAGRINSHEYYIDDKTKDVFKMANKIRKYRLKHGTRVFIVDYLQLVSASIGKNQTREREVAVISRTFKEVCLDLDVVIIELSQLSRKVASRDDKEPMLSDLRESGAIEQDADMVIFPYRPAYYVKENNVIPPKEDAMWIIAKGRGTGLKRIPMVFQSYTTNYFNGHTIDDQEEIEFQAGGDLTADF